MTPRLGSFCALKPVMLKRPLLLFVFACLLRTPFAATSLENSVDATPPTIEDTTPAPGEIVTESRSIEVLFNENVQGVDVSDLFINGKVATGLLVVSPRNYVFQFAPLANGSVTVQWSADHNITDLSNNPFAGGMWGYSVDSTLPPVNVIISEFMADNENGIRDDDSQRSDWIEIYNA